MFDIVDEMYDMTDDEMVERYFNQHVQLSGGPPVTPDMTERERCITEFQWVHEQEKIAHATVESIRYIADGGKLH